ncbi:hypothetical protein VKT23_018106 [Stygiomarasmius scandens]|uniref:Serpentine receptor class gamma n=1 Tax=Marasmiellus scandens TaxID=2682957 RepID=A0ABR1ITD0_9AGAR
MGSGTSADTISFTFILATEYLVYGIYFVLFAFSLVVLQRRKAKKQANNSIHFFSMIALFVFTTCSEVHVIVAAGFSFALLTNLISDLLIVYRMYLIWGKKKRYTIVPLLISICNHGVAVLAVAFILPTLERADIPKEEGQAEMVFYMINLSANIVVSLLNAGKIYSLTRKAHLILKSSVRKFYCQAIAIILESGVIFVLVHIILLVTVLVFPDTPTTMIPVFVPALASVPTLIIVRAGLGLTVENAEGVIETQPAQYHNYQAENCDKT